MVVLNTVTGDKSSNLVLTFSNDSENEMFIVIDPPCEEFQVNVGGRLKLILYDFRLYKQDISEIVDFRYETGRINIDVNFNLKIGVEIDGELSVIWNVH